GPGDDRDAGDVPRAGPGGLGRADRCGDVADPGGGDPATRPGGAGAVAADIAGVAGRADRPRSDWAGGPGDGTTVPPGVPDLADAVAGPQPGALARVPAEGPVAVGPRGLGDLYRALRQLQCLHDRRDDRRQPRGPRVRRRDQRTPGGGRAAL